MANRILRWFVYTLVLALLPILITLLFGILFDLDINDYNTELLFFVIMICATSLNDIQKTKNLIQNDFVFNLFFSICMIIIVTVSAMYGGILLREMTHSTLGVLNNNINKVAVVLSIISGILGLIIQVILHRVEVLE